MYFPETPPIGSTFTVIENDGSDPILGEFNNVPQTPKGVVLNLDGDPDYYGGQRLLANYNGGDGNDFTLTVVAPAIAKDETESLAENSGQPGSVPSSPPTFFVSAPGVLANDVDRNDLPLRASS